MLASEPAACALGEPGVLGMSVVWQGWCTYSGHSPQCRFTYGTKAPANRAGGGCLAATGLTSLETWRNRISLQKGERLFNELIGLNMRLAWCTDWKRGARSWRNSWGPDRGGHEDHTEMTSSTMCTYLKLGSIPSFLLG